MDQQQPAPARQRSFANPSAGSGALQIARTAGKFAAQPFQPLPASTGPAPYHLPLDQVVRSAGGALDPNSTHLVFHMAGDTGGIRSPEPQQIVAMQMESDFDPPAADARPAFFYHLGDVVCYNGEAAQYYPQYYEPYTKYPAPIFAIPGNHDGDPLPGATSLAAFVENFCAATPTHTAEAGDAARDAMTQPNVYWTLEAPFVTIVGLYSNVPDGGEIHQDQAAWFQNELQSAPADKALLVAMHHPVYSGDSHHGGSTHMETILNAAITASGRTPDAVFAGHVHNYQRFTRRLAGREIPFIVAGAGGYWHLHYLAKHLGDPIQTPFVLPTRSDLTLESYCDDRHGYLRLEVTAQTLRGEYFAVPRPQEGWRTPAPRIDTFTLDLQQHRLVR